MCVRACVLACVQGHADQNHENNKCLIISETVQATPIMFAVKIVRLKVYYDYFQSDGLDLHSRSKVRLTLDLFLTCYIVSDVFKLLHSHLA